MPKKQVIKPADPFLFLIGNKGAINRLAGTWWTLLIGALLVITAGIARNYDHLYLIDNWEWLYAPFIASLTTSVIIYIIGCGSFLKQPKAKTSYLSFLSLYWMTSPCAWIYGIPVESFTDILTATKWNVSFLAIVSIWRVLLMIRAINVLADEPIIKSTCRILLPAAAIMTVASFFKGIALVGIMGGVRLSPSDTFLKQATDITTQFSFYTTIVSFLTIPIINLKHPKSIPQPLPWKSIPTPKIALAYSCILIVIWLGATIPYQHQTKNNHIVKAYLDNNEYYKALNYMAKYERSDFLINHHFPPGRATGTHHIFLLHNDIILLQNIKPTHPEWIRAEIIKNLNLDNTGPSKTKNTVYLYLSLTKTTPKFTATTFSKTLWQEIKLKHNLTDPSDEELDQYRDLLQS